MSEYYVGTGLVESGCNAWVENEVANYSEAGSAEKPGDTVTVYAVYNLDGCDPTPAAYIDFYWWRPYEQTWELVASIGFSEGQYYGYIYAYAEIFCDIPGLYKVEFLISGESVYTRYFSLATGGTWKTDCSGVAFWVFDSDDNPLSSVEISIDGNPNCYDGVGNCYTNSNGYCALFIKPNMTFTFTASKEGYEPVRYRSSSGNSDRYFTITMSESSGGCPDIVPDPDISGDDISVDPDPPVAGDTMVCTIDLGDLPDGVTSRYVHLYVDNETTGENYYDDCICDKCTDSCISTPVDLPDDCAGDCIRITYYVWNICTDGSGDHYSNSDSAYKDVYPVSSGSTIDINVHVRNSSPPNDPLSGATVNIRKDNETGEVVGTCITDDNGDCTVSNIPQYPTYYIEAILEGYICLDCGPISGNTSQNVTVNMMEVTCPLHFVVDNPVRYLKKGEDLIFTGYAPNLLDEVATVKVVFTKPDGSTDDTTKEDVSPCTQYEFSKTFEYSDDLYGNWTAELYNNDQPTSEPTIYIQILTEEELRKKEDQLKRIAILLSIAGVALFAYYIFSTGE